MSGRERLAPRDAVRHARFATRNTLVGASVIAISAMVMAVVAGTVSAGYQWFAYGWPGPIWWEAMIGTVASLVYAVPFLVRGEYTIPAYLAGGRRPQRVFMSWNAAFLTLLALAFVTQTTAAVSRGAAILFYGVGLLVMIGLESGVRSTVVRGLANGWLPPRRVMLVGRADQARLFMARLDRAGGSADRIGIRVIAVTNIPERIGAGAGLTLADALDRAVCKARSLLPDDIVIVTPRDDDAVIDAAVAAFETLPVAIHLDGGAVLSRYHDVQLRRVGGSPTLSLAEVPLTPVQAMAKRGFDVCAASIALVLAAPLFALIIILIRLDSAGPVFFRQERRGFNQQRFRIWKFRTMQQALPVEGARFEQAKRDDPRITRVGRLLRKTSLDELPQLFNVIAGSMSLVGPRPHAVDHDRDFERRIGRYPRRLNMKPGITGWAQVNGFRGETDTDEKMQRRVEADLFYIDNWSLLFDAYIVVMTVLSPKVFRNAR